MVALLGGGEEEVMVPRSEKRSLGLYTHGSCILPCPLLAFSVFSVCQELNGLFYHMIPLP